MFCNKIKYISIYFAIILEYLGTHNNLHSFIHVWINHNNFKNKINSGLRNSGVQNIHIKIHYRNTDIKRKWRKTKWPHPWPEFLIAVWQRVYLVLLTIWSVQLTSEYGSTMFKKLKAKVVDDQAKSPLRPTQNRTANQVGVSLSWVNLRIWNL